MTITWRLQKKLRLNRKGNPFHCFGVERFFENVYGNKFTITNDQQPLKSVFSTPIVRCLPRIQKFFLRLQKYEFDFKYSSRTTMLVLGALSGAYIENSKPEFNENSLVY